MESKPFLLGDWILLTKWMFSGVGQKLGTSPVILCEQLSATKLARNFGITMCLIVFT